MLPELELTINDDEETPPEIDNSGDVNVTVIVPEPTVEPEPEVELAPEVVIVPGFDPTPLVQELDALKARVEVLETATSTIEENEPELLEKPEDVLPATFKRKWNSKYFGPSKG